MKVLPVFKTSFKSVGYTFSNFGELFKVAMPWILIYSAFTLVFQFLGIEEYYELERSLDYVARFPEAAQDNGYETLSQLQLKFETLSASMGIAANLHYLLDKLVLAVAYSAVGVVWYRGFLLSEKPPKMRFAALEFKFFVYLLLYVAIVIAIFMLVYYLAQEFNIARAGNLAFASLIISIFMVLFAARFLMVFAGVSVSDKRMNPLLSWRVTKGNSWRLYGGGLLIMLMSIPIWILKAIIGTFNLPIFIDWPVQAFLTLVIGAYMFSFTAICYQYFVPPPKVGDLE